MNIQTTHITIPTMTCGSCGQRVRTALRELAGVDRVDVRLSSRQVDIDHDPQATPVAKLVAAIEKAGYGVAESSSTTPMS